MCAHRISNLRFCYLSEDDCIFRGSYHTTQLENSLENGIGPVKMDMVIILSIYQLLITLFVIFCVATGCLPFLGQSITFGTVVRLCRSRDAVFMF